MPESTKKYSVPAVESMLAIVEFLAGEKRAFGVSELTERLGVSKNMVYRITRYLEQQGYMESVDGNGKYQLGRGFYRIGIKLAGRYELVNRSHPHLCWLSEQTGETANIQVSAGERMMVADVVFPPSDYYFHLNKGTKLFYHCNAMGKCVLAHRDEEEINQVVPSQLPIQTPNTLKSRAELKDELKRVRETGLGHDREEYVPGIYCIAAPVFNVHGEVVAGVGITGLVARLVGRNREEFEALVREAGERISSAMGHAS